MSNHWPSPLAPVHHGLPTDYPPCYSSAPSPSYPPAPSLPTIQYASYPAVAAAPQPGDAYRVSPVGNTQMSLPSMRVIDPMLQQPEAPPMPHHSMFMSMNMPLAAISAAPPNYSNHPMLIPSNDKLPQDALAQYPLPHDPQLVGHQGPKEIKRRTKTGCLTCRKRRIKCDETHPTCNNCRKSTRDCLGYNPISKK